MESKKYNFKELKSSWVDEYSWEIYEAETDESVTATESLSEKEDSGNQ